MYLQHRRQNLSRSYSQPQVQTLNIPGAPEEDNARQFQQIPTSQGLTHSQQFSSSTVDFSAVSGESDVEISENYFLDMLL